MLALLVVPVAPASAAKKFQVVVFGDSFGSGEGAPAVNGDYGPTGARLGHLRSDRDQPDPPADWGGSAADLAFTGDTRQGVRGRLSATRCHRSPKATAPRAVRQLEGEFPDIDFTFRSFACSGARIDEGVTGTYAGAEFTREPHLQADERVPTQIEQANAYLDGVNRPAGTARRIDALVMNIGGNNLGFANLIQRCMNIGPEFPFNPCNPRSFGGLGNDDTLNVFETGAGLGALAGVSGLDDLPGLYRGLDARIDRVPGTPGRLGVRPAEVYLTGPPNPIAGSDFSGCLTGANDYEKNLQVTERNWLKQEIFPRMVGAMSTESVANGWEFVDMAPHVTKGMCSSSGRMFNRNRDSLRHQGATVASELNIAVSHGIAHPNSAGYAAMAPVLAGAMRSQVIDAFTPSAPGSPSVPAPLVDLGPRVQLRIPGAPEDYPTRPAVRRGTTTIAGPPGEGLGTIEVPLTTSSADSISLEARRCGPLSPGAPLPQGCGDVRAVSNVLVGTPGVPTGVTASASPQGVRVNWTKGSAAGRTLRRFLVTATSSVGTTSLMGNLNITEQFSIAPELRSSILPLEPGDWRISVRECTDRGCGGGSPTLSVRSNGAIQFDPEDLARRTELQQFQQFSPVGVFATPAGRRARAGRPFRLQLSWGVWRQWKDLRQLRLRMVGERGELGMITVQMGSGRVTVSGPGSRARRGRIGRRGALRARAFALRTHRARIVGAGKRGRLVALELPLALSRTLRRQRVDVDVAASSRGGRHQHFGPAGSFRVR